jgi:hypothetical protein
MYSYNASVVCNRLERFSKKKKLFLFSKLRYATREFAKIYNVDVVTLNRRIGCRCAWEKIAQIFFSQIGQLLTTD